MNPFRIPVQRQAAPVLRYSVPRFARRAEPAFTAHAAHVVPWRVVRRAEGVIEVEHCGSGPLHSVRFALAGDGVLGLSLPRTVFPGERIRALVRGSDAVRAADSADAMLVLRWFQPEGEELLWPIAL